MTGLKVFIHTHVHVSKIWPFSKPLYARCFSVSPPTFGQASLWARGTDANVLMFTFPAVPQMSNCTLSGSEKSHVFSWHPKSCSSLPCQLANKVKISQSSRFLTPTSQGTKPFCGNLRLRRSSSPYNTKLPGALHPCVLPLTLWSNLIFLSHDSSSRTLKPHSAPYLLFLK